jgi:hypothetical protein
MNNSTIEKCNLITEIDPETNTEINPYQSLVLLRTIGLERNRIPITTLEGRTSGNNIVFTPTTTYDDYKMRRKAEVLKYRLGNNAPGVIRTNKEIYKGLLSTNRNNYSSTKLKQLILENQNCNSTNVISKPYQSGINDPYFPGYYLDPTVGYFSSL